MRFREILCFPVEPQKDSFLTLLGGLLALILASLGFTDAAWSAPWSPRRRFWDLFCSTCVKWLAEESLRSGPGALSNPCQGAPAHGLRVPGPHGQRYFTQSKLTRLMTPRGRRIEQDCGQFQIRERQLYSQRRASWIPVCQGQVG